MGDYAYMQGTAKIRAKSIKPLQAFFNTRHDDPEFDLVWSKLEEYFPEMRVYAAYNILKNGRSTRIPFGMPNPSGWPSDFDELQFETGELELTDEGRLTFKCSNRNHDSVMQAFIALLPVFATSWRVEYNDNEFRLGYSQGDSTVYSSTAKDKEALEHLIGMLCERADEMERSAALWRLAPLTADELITLREIGISETFINGLDGPSAQLKDVPTEPTHVKAWSALVRAKLDAMGIPMSLFTQSAPRGSESFAEFAVRLGMQNPTVPTPKEEEELGPQLEIYTSTLEHIAAYKLRSRGKKGYNQLTRKSRRNCRA